MKYLLIKELRLAASPLSYIFLVASLMTLLPGYPILMSAFFICFGIFHSFQSAREANDTIYTVLLPVKKRDFVRAKFTFTCLIQAAGFVLCAALTVLRMTLLADAGPYVSNALMNATPYYLTFVLLIFTAFNVLFVGGFFKTGYKIGIPFLIFGIAAFLLIVPAEILPHIPGLAFLHTPSGERLGLQLILLLGAAVIWGISTVLACRKAEERFEKIDL